MVCATLYVAIYLQLRPHSVHCRLSDQRSRSWHFSQLEMGEGEGRGRGRERKREKEEEEGKENKLKENQMKSTKLKL